MEEETIEMYEKQIPEFMEELKMYVKNNYGTATDESYDGNEMVEIIEQWEQEFDCIVQELKKLNKQKGCAKE